MHIVLIRVQKLNRLTGDKSNTTKIRNLGANMGKNKGYKASGLGGLQNIQQIYFKYTYRLFI